MSVLRRCTEGFSESIIQLCIQVMVLMVTWPIDNTIDGFQIASIITSTLSVSASAAYWFCLVSGNDKPSMIVVLSLAVLYILILLPRAFGAALIYAYQRDIGLLLLSCTVSISLPALLCLNYANDDTKHLKEYVVHSIFDVVASCSYMGEIVKGSIINIVVQGASLLLLYPLVVYDVREIIDCTIPIFSRNDVLLSNTSSMEMCIPYEQLCWRSRINDTGYDLIYPLRTWKCSGRNENILFYYIIPLTLICLALTLIPAKIIDNLRETQDTPTWLERGVGFLHQEGKYEMSDVEEALSLIHI